MKKFIEPAARLITVDLIATDTNINIGGSGVGAGDPGAAPVRAGVVAAHNVTDFD